MNTRQALSSSPLAHVLDLTGPTMNRQHDWPAADAAIFDQGLLTLRRVDLKRKRLAAMRTNDFRFVNQFHFASGSQLELPAITAVDQRLQESSSNTILDRMERQSRALN